MDKPVLTLENTTVDEVITWLEYYSDANQTRLYSTPAGLRYFVHPAEVVSRTLAMTVRENESATLKPRGMKRVVMHATLIWPESGPVPPGMWLPRPLPLPKEALWRARDILCCLDQGEVLTQAERGDVKLVTKQEAIYLEISSCGRRDVSMIAPRNHPGVIEYFSRLEAAIRNDFETSPTAVSAASGDGPAGPGAADQGCEVEAEWYGLDHDRREGRKMVLQARQQRRKNEEIAKLLTVSSSTIDRHIKWLREQGCLDCKRDCGVR